MYGPRVKRFTRFFLCLALGLMSLAGVGMAQSQGRGHGGGDRGGARAFQAPPARYGPPPAPGGRFAGPYGYAYPPGAYPAYGGAQPPYATGPYRPPSYPPPAAPVVRRPNSLGADWRLQQEEARFGVRHGQFAPLGRVVENIRRRTPGRQLDAGIEYDGGRAVYRVRWITDRGQRMDFLVDAASGAILGQR